MDDVLEDSMWQVDGGIDLRDDVPDSVGGQDVELDKSPYPSLTLAYLAVADRFEDLGEMATK